MKLRRPFKGFIKDIKALKAYKCYVYVDYNMLKIDGNVYIDLVSSVSIPDNDYRLRNNVMEFVFPLNFLLISKKLLTQLIEKKYNQNPDAPRRYIFYKKPVYNEN